MTELNAESTQTPPKEEFVRSLANGLRVLETFAEGEEQMTLSEVARRTGLSRAAARRMLHTLVHLGYATTDGRHFALTPKVLGLGLGFWSGNGLRDLLQPALRSLAAELNESCSASVLVGDEVIYIARAHTRRIMRMDLDVGTRLPAFATSMGRVLLSGLPEADVRRVLDGSDLAQLTPATITDLEELLEIVNDTREAGHAMVDQELEAGLRSVAVPVTHPERGVIAAMNVSVATGLESATTSLGRVLGPLQTSAAAVSRAVVAWEDGTGQVSRH